MKINNKMYKMKLFTECGMPALQFTNCCPLFQKINKQGIGCKVNIRYIAIK